MSDAGQNEEQGELAESPLAEGAGDAEIGGYLFERMEETEDGAAGGFGNGGQIEFALEQTAENLSELQVRPFSILQSRSQGGRASCRSQPGQSASL